MFELTNQQREYFGLPPISTDWTRKILPPDTHRPECTLLFEEMILRRKIVSTVDEYLEVQFEEETKDLELFLPKTSKGSEKRITQATLESKTPIDAYVSVSGGGRILIGNHSNQLTFFDSLWEDKFASDSNDIQLHVKRYIAESANDHLSQIKDFVTAKRRKVNYQPGDVFRFRLNRREYGFGILLLDINRIRKKGLVPKNHGLTHLMGPPLLVRFFAIRTENPEIRISDLEEAQYLPSDYIMDNALFYGNYQIVGSKNLVEHDFDFPLSYGRSLDRNRMVVFLQWGLIHLELPLSKFDKYLQGEIESLPITSPSRAIGNPYGYYSIGFRSVFNSSDIYRTIASGSFSFDQTSGYRSKLDLRNPRNRDIRIELLKKFGISPTATYFEVAKKLKAPDLFETIRKAR